MYDYQLHQKIGIGLEKASLKTDASNLSFYSRFIANISSIYSLFSELYGTHLNADALFDSLVDTIIKAHKNRSEQLNKIDILKSEKGNWFLSNELAGMSLYVDLFSGTLNNLETKLDYFKKTGINVLHLMPLFESPLGESDGGYAVSNFRKPDTRFGTLADLEKLRKKMSDEDMYLMMDIVLNHTSHNMNGRKRQRPVIKSIRIFFTCMRIEIFLMSLRKICPKFFLIMHLEISLTIRKVTNG